MSATLDHTEHEVVLAPVPARDHAPVVQSRNPDDFAYPVGREEEWRFTPLARFARLLGGDPSVAHLEWDVDLPDGVSMTEVQADDPWLLELPLPVDRLSALASARSDGAVRLAIPARTQVDGPVLVGLHGGGPDTLTWGHLVIEVGELSAATVVIEHSGSAQYGEHLDVVLAQGASLQLVHVQNWDDDAVHGAHVAIRLGRDASLRSTQVSLGGHATRVVETVDYTGPGGSASLNGLFFSGPDQHIEHRLFVDHSAPHCSSRVTYKGALQGEGARSVWVGDVLIRAGARGTDTYEINRNLILSDGARADSVPNLEIETGEVVGAGHASATGRFDDEQLFYLQARGIPAAEARRLVVLGFFADVLGKLGLPDVEANVLTSVAADLDAGDERFDFAAIDAGEEEQ